MWINKKFYEEQREEMTSLVRANEKAIKANEKEMAALKSAVVKNEKEIAAFKQTVTKNEKEMVTLRKATEKKLDAVRKALLRNADFAKSEQELRKAVADIMPYITVDLTSSITGKSFQFIFDSKDPYMAKHMFGFGKDVHSEQELNLFIELSKRYYGITPEDGGTFFDVGGNIGTTSVYVAKCWPTLDVVAFEPGEDNCRTFRLNGLLNDCEIALYHMGLGEKTSTAVLARSADNMGDHRILNECIEGRKTEETLMDTFDHWMEEHPQKVSYIWMDTQGYEGFVMEGMKKTLDGQRFPIWMEFCPVMLEQAGSFEKLMSVLGTYFESYIDRHDLDSVHDIKDLYLLQKELRDEKATDLFLIRKGIKG